MALVVADGGSLYWNPHPDDDPMGMITDELIPRLRARGLGAGVMVLAGRLPSTATLHISPGCHHTAFFTQQQLPSLRFLGDHLGA
jgi:hypothetical protein